MKAVLYCDASVRYGGRAGIGVVVADADSGLPLKRWGEPLDTPATCNEAEYIALVRGLQECLRMGATSVEVYLDSALVYGQLVQGWQCHHEHLRRLRDEAQSLLEQFEHWSIERVPSAHNPLAHTYANIASLQNRKGGTRTMIVEFTEHTPLPTGSYPARVVAVEPKSGQYGEQLQFTLEVSDGKHAGRRLRAWCNPSTSTNGKLYRWARALLGEAPTRLDTRELVGRECLAQVVLQQSPNGTVYSRVQDLLPVDGYDPFEDED
ncbi:MAG: reverse transcriptase-like protein [Armatimonadota bacterium]